MAWMPKHLNSAPLAGLALRCQPDVRLVTLSREGHERAFEEIVRRYRGPLVAFAGGIVPPHRAEDVVQDALSKAHAALSASAAEIRLKPWLYTIVRNGALNDLRDEPAHEHLDENFDGVPQPPDVVANREALAAVLALVKTLPPAQREAIVKRELEGRGHEEIALALGLTPGAVRGLIFRARTTLRNGIGLLIPLPVLRTLAHASGLQAEATGAGLGGGAAAGLLGGGGGTVIVKAGAALVLAGLAIGGGVALQGAENGPAHTATAAENGHARSDRDQGAGGERGGPRGGSSDSARRGDGPGSGDSSHGGSGSGSSSVGSPERSGGGEGEAGGGSGGGDDGSSSGDDGRSGGGTSGDDGGATSGGDDGASGTSGESGSGGDGDTSGGDTSGSDDGTSGGSGGEGDGTTTTSAASSEPDSLSSGGSLDG